MSRAAAGVGNWLNWSLPVQREFGMSEWMDEPEADEALLVDSLRFLTHLNRRMGWARATVDAVVKLSAGKRELHILDVGTGAGDLPAAMVEDARLAGCRVVGIDLHEQTVKYAKCESRGRYDIIRGDALALPFADASVDICTCGLFLHHLPSEQAIKALAEMRRVSRLGVVAGDLLRSRQGLLGIRLLGLLTNAMVRHDGEVSVRQAFKVSELTDMFATAQLRVVECRTMWGIRIVLAGVK